MTTIERRAERFTQLEERLEEQPLPEKSAFGHVPDRTTGIVEDISWNPVEELPDWFLEQEAQEKRRWKPKYIEEDNLDISAEPNPEEDETVSVCELLDDEYATFFIDIDGDTAVIFVEESEFSHGLITEFRSYPNVESVSDLLEMSVPIKRVNGRQFEFVEFSNSVDWLDDDVVWDAYMSGNLPDSDNPFNQFEYPAYVKLAGNRGFAGLMAMIGGMVLISSSIFGSLYAMAASFTLLAFAIFMTQSHRLARYIFYRKNK